MIEISRPSTRARNFLRVCFFFLFFFLCVFVCIYVSLSFSLRALLLRSAPLSTFFRAPADESSTSRECAASCMASSLMSHFPVDILSDESASCPSPRFPVDSLAVLHAVDIDLKVGRFLVSLIPAEDVLKLVLGHELAQVRHEEGGALRIADGYVRL